MSRLILFFLMILPFTVLSQESDSKIVITKTSPENEKILQESKPQGAHNIPVPKFVIKTKDNNFIMAIGGFINPIMGYDIGNNLYNISGAGISFVTNKIPVPALAGHKADYYINPINGAIDLQVVGLTGTSNQITGYIKVGTNGVSTEINVTRAYITWKRFTAGMKLTLLQDEYACQPPTIDPQGPCGCISTISYEISYKSKSYNGFRFALGLDMPSYYSSNGYYYGKDFPDFDNEQVACDEYENAEQLVPDIPMWVQYEFSPFNRIRVSGIIRNFAYRDLIADNTRHTTGWGIMLSGNVNPWKPLILYYQAAYGRGIGNYLQDIAGQPLSFIPNDKKPGELKASPMMGINFGATFNINPKWQINIMGSESRIWDVGSQCMAKDAPSNYKYALYAGGNVFFNITTYLQAGIEYLWGHHQTWNIGGAHDSRIQVQLMFTL